MTKTWLLVALPVLAGVALAVAFGLSGHHRTAVPTAARPAKNLVYEPCLPTLDESGYASAIPRLPRWQDGTSLEQMRASYERLGYRLIGRLDTALERGVPPDQVIEVLLHKASLYLYEGDARRAYDVLQTAREEATASDPLAEKYLYTIIFFQGMAGLRRGETDNCVHCRGEGACIFPLTPTAVHTDPTGSRLAIKHFTEYLDLFPEDRGVRWLLNLAYITVGEYPDHVPPRYRMSFDHFGHDADIGRFNEISQRVGLTRLNMWGGAVMDDFDNDGLLDLVVTTFDPTQPMAFYRNKGDGTFEERIDAAGLGKQTGGLNLVQTDYNNDGNLDVFVVRGAWIKYPVRPSLLRNNGDGTFTDVTRAAGLLAPVNSNCAAWADFDNDGFLDVYVCNETGFNRLYRNKGDGTFEEIAARAGVQGKNAYCKGAVWFDYDNDGYPDLFVTYLDSTPQLFHNDKNGTFTDVTREMGITGPTYGFSCWAFDYDNDGWPDIFATSYQRSLDDLVRGLQGEPPTGRSDVTRLYRNLGGKRFQDVSKETGVDKVFATMGSNFADFDNDGYLDFYLGTGDPRLSTLVPNRMFKNDGGKRFLEITATAGTGHLQKGHGVACGDWRRCGSVDLFVQTGGAVPGDRYHNLLFQNPGQGNDWLTVKLIGKKTNRAAIGARIKVVTAGKTPLTVYRHVASGSSFGANPLQQTIGLGKAAGRVRVEVWWPTSRTTQVFEDVPVNQAIEITEFAPTYRPLHWTPVPLPRE
jgi:hypothetical protein